MYDFVPYRCAVNKHTNTNHSKSEQMVYMYVYEKATFENELLTDIQYVLLRLNGHLSSKGKITKISSVRSK